MQPVLVEHKIEKENSSFKVWRNANPYMHNRWHFHKEFEVTFIEKGNGTRFIGDSLQKYTSGDLILVGANLPHEWRSDKDENLSFDYYSSSLAVHFMKDFPGSKFYDMPETFLIKKLLETSRQGISILDNVIKSKIQKKLEKMIHSKSNGMDRIMGLFSILEIIASSDKIEILASKGFAESFENSKNYRINVIYKYITENFNKPISLNHIAALINMTPNSFCRYFKNCTNKSFIEYLNEIRIRYACKLLIEENNNIIQIAFLSGFNNLSNFNRNFKRIMGKSPTEYIKESLLSVKN